MIRLEKVNVNCTYVGTIFYNEQDCGTVAKYRAVEETDLPVSVLRKERVFTAVGTMLPRSKYQTITFVGNWSRNNKYKEDQLRVKHFEATIEPSKQNIIGYLSSEAVKGIGPDLARKIFDEFGLNSIHILENDPEQLLKIKGIKQATLEMIIESFRVTKPLKEIMSFLGQYNISMSKAKKILDTYGGKAVTVLRQEPFKLCEIKGFGYLTVDEMAKKMGAPLDSLYRIREAIKYVMVQNGGDGHLFIEKNLLVERSYDLLNHEMQTETVSEERIKEVANNMVTQEQLRHVGGYIYLYKDYLHESRFVADVLRLIRTRSKGYCTRELAVRLIGEAQKKFGLELGDKQYEGVLTSLTCPINIITGGPGTGKTTALLILVECLLNLDIPPEEVILCAPTGRAAQRMSQSTNFPASTIHSFLKLRDDEDDEDVEQVDDISRVILDEASMVDQYLAHRLFGALPDGTGVTLVGDIHQLPSIGPGNVLRELILSEVIPVTTLDIGYRQGKMSTIAINGKKIVAGDTNLIYKSDFVFLPARTEEKALELLLKQYEKHLSNGEIDDVQILCPRREKGACGKDNVNKVIQERFNPPNGGPEIRYGNQVFRIGDKVMNNKNKNGVSNGDIGVIEDIRRSQENDKEYEAVIRFDSTAGTRRYRRSDFEHVELAWAITVHKAQGSEYEIVIMPLLYTCRVMLVNPMINTAVTRAKRMIEIIGQKAALSHAIRTKDSNERNTLVARRLQTAYRRFREDAAKK